MRHPRPFREAFGKEHRYYNEVASVYTEIFHRYGYLTPDRLVPDEEWPGLLTAALHRSHAASVS